MVNEAVGAPGSALPVPVAPMAPEPPVPVVSTPVNVITVIEAATLFASAAVTDALLKVVDENARQISAVPSCVFVRLTKVQVRLAPVTPVTVMLAAGASVETKANNNSLALVVENVGDTIVVALELRSVDTV